LLLCCFAGSNIVIKKLDYSVSTLYLTPPRLLTSSEIGFSPGREGDNVIINIAVSEGERERSRSTDLLTLGIVLRSVARAHKLVFVLVPGNYATQMGADGVDSVFFNGTLIGNNEVSSLTLQLI
jgi:hypothetical protein